MNLIKAWLTLVLSFMMVMSALVVAIIGMSALSELARTLYHSYNQWRAQRVIRADAA